jgi:hypothetical protein
VCERAHQPPTGRSRFVGPAHGCELPLRRNATIASPHPSNVNPRGIVVKN